MDKNDTMDKNEILYPERLSLIERPDYSVKKEDLMAVANVANNIVDNVATCVSNVANTAKEIAVISAQMEVETRRLDHVLDCLLVKAQNNLQIYRDTLPLLDKNFSTMQARMDRLMDRAMDLLCEDVSDESLARQEAIMKMIEMTNNSINSLVVKLMPSHT